MSIHYYFCRDDYGPGRNRAKSQIKISIFRGKVFTRRKILSPSFFFFFFNYSDTSSIDRGEYRESKFLRALRYVNQHGNYELDSRPTFSPKSEYKLLGIVSLVRNLG